MALGSAPATGDLTLKSPALTVCRPDAMLVINHEDMPMGAWVILNGGVGMLLQMWMIRR